ncbi:uncharacterized protein LOC134069870 isoform X2 [Sardina pilchardus]
MKKIRKSRLKPWIPPKSTHATLHLPVAVSAIAPVPASAPTGSSSGPLCPEETEESHEFVATTEEVVSLSFSKNDQYCYELCTSEHLMLCSHPGKNQVYLMERYHEENFTTTSKYVFVQRKVVEFSDHQNWCYSCSCDAGVQKQLAVIKKSNLTFSEFLVLYPNCLHIQTLITVIGKELRYDEATDESSVFLEIPFDTNKFIFGGLSGYTVVSAKDGKVYCHHCSIHFACHHVKELRSLQHVTHIAEFLGGLGLGQFHQEVIPRPVSTHPISFDQVCFSSCPQEAFVSKDGLLQLLPEVPGVCDCGAGMANIPVEDKKARLFTSTGMFPVQTYKYQCTDCKNAVQYEGGSQCIVNMGSYLIHHEVLRDYMFHFLFSGSSIYSYTKVWEQRAADHGVADFHRHMSYHKFRHAWHAFLGLLNFPTEEGFLCPTCGSEPQQVVMDGTTLGYHQRYSRRTSAHTEDTYLGTGSRYIDRVLLPQKKIRDMLGNYIKSIPTSIPDFECLKAEVERGAGFLSPLLRIFEDGGHTSHPPEPFCPLLQEVVKATPACALLHPGSEVERLVREISSTPSEEIPHHTDLMRTLAHHCPLLWDLVAACGHFPEEVKPLLKRMAQVAWLAYDVPPLGECASVPQQDELSFFPHLPTRRPRGAFLMDRQRREDSQEAGCHKSAGHHAALIPGLFTMFCSHGVCYGFSIMENCESVNIPFTILRSHFTSGPGTVLYDNACKLHSYALNRDPQFFINTWFLVDRLHWKNHSACSSGYNTNRYPQFGNINTQVAEQYNAKLKRLKHHLPYMAKQHFLQHLKLYLWYHSRNVARKLQR